MFETELTDLLRPPQAQGLQGAAVLGVPGEPRPVGGDGLSAAGRQQGAGGGVLRR